MPLRRPAALVGAGMAALTAGIVSNAVFLQPGRHPAPLFSTRAPVAEPEVVRPDMLVEAIQEALREGGFYAGPVDGTAGPRTNAAIAAFERQAGRDSTGLATPDLLDAILAAEVATAPATLAAPDNFPIPASLPPDKRVAAVQGALSRAAYGQITADGVLGPQTRDAIRQFQADHGLPLTGEIDDALIATLAAAGALEGE